jgi:peptidoglycan/LPS O-acetylase OafA/YrhL
MNEPANNRPRQTRFRVLDIYRFAAALGIVIYHFSANFSDDAVLRALTNHFYLFVDFFFVLSGFVIAHSYAHRVASLPEIGTFLQRRVARIYPLYVLTLTIYVAAIVGGISSHPENYHVPWIVSQFAMVSAWSPNAPMPLNYPSWSISVEWAMYLLFPAMALIQTRYGRVPLAVIAACSVMALWMLLSYRLLDADSFGLIFNPLRALPTFTAGIIISASLRQIRHGVLIGALCFVSAVAGMMVGLKLWAIIGLFFCTVYFTAAGEACGSPPLSKSRFAAFLGDISYSVYLLHALVLSILFEHLWKRFTNSPVPLPYLVPAEILLIIIAAAVFFGFEAPMRRWLSAIRFSQPFVAKQRGVLAATSGAKAETNDGSV